MASQARRTAEEEEAIVVATIKNKSNAAKFFLNGILPQTALARTLRYESLLPEAPQCASPMVLNQLIDELDIKTPPLQRLLSGMTQNTLKCAGALLNCLITDEKRDFVPLLIKSLPVGVIVQMVQILLLRFREPAFFASSAYCDYVHTISYMLNPRGGVCRNETSRSSTTTGHKYVSACMARMSPHQQAVTATVIKFCQKACQAHMGYMMHKRGHNDSTLEYAEAVSFLSSLFSSCLIGVPQSYVARRYVGSDFGSVAALKRDIFIHLVNTVTQERWHMLAMRAMGVDICEGEYDEEKCDNGKKAESSQARDVSIDDYHETRQAGSANTSTNSIRKNISFSWV